MDKKTCYLIFLMVISAIMAGNAIADNIIITQVLYDPPGADNYKEWVELYNPTDENISLENYSLETGNGASEDSWKKDWVGAPEEMIYAKSYYLIGEQDSAAIPDSTVNLDLQNGPDACRLSFNSQIIDLVGWGEHDYIGYYEFEPAIDVSDGSSIKRNSNNGLFIDSGNNHDDFYENQDPDPQNSGIISMDSDSQQIQLILNIEHQNYWFEYLNMTDEDKTKEGIQVIPNPGGNKIITITTMISSDQDLTDLDEIKASVNHTFFSLHKSIDINRSHAVFSGNISFGYKQPPGDYIINFSIKARQKEFYFENIFEYESLMALWIDSNLLNFSNVIPGSNITLLGDTNTSTKDTLSIMNIGNSVFDIGIKGGNLVSDIDLIPSNNIRYSIDNDFNSVRSGFISDTMDIIEVELKSGMVLPIGFSINVPENVTALRYTAKITLVAVPDGD
ncbi:MAG: lamin tail domain-containing protein [Candidatus Woesearchaeota archaeon]